MNKDLWIAKVIENKYVLRYFIESYHPANTHRKIHLRPNLPITAPNVERVRLAACEQIKATSLDCPEVQFDLAVQKKDWTTVANLFEHTWFGVPESTSYWSIPGASIMVDLMDDPIDFDESSLNPVT
jgi:hypothetical protein